MKAKKPKPITKEIPATTKSIMHCTLNPIGSTIFFSVFSSIRLLGKEPREKWGKWLNEFRKRNWDLYPIYKRKRFFFFGNCESFWHMMMMMMRDSIQIFEEEGPDAVCSVVAVLALFEWIIYGSHMDPFGPYFSCFWSLELTGFLLFLFFFLTTKFFFLSIIFFSFQNQPGIMVVSPPKKKKFLFFFIFTHFCEW